MRKETKNIREFTREEKEKKIIPICKEYTNFLTKLIAKEFQEHNYRVMAYQEIMTESMARCLAIVIESNPKEKMNEIIDTYIKVIVLKLSDYLKKEVKH